jgi:prolyl-tRNA synthetase
MKQSNLLAKTKKTISKDIVAVSHKYLIKADFIEQSISGVYRFLPLGFKVLQKIKNIIREEMHNLGAQEVLLSALQDKKLWQETNRWDTIDPPLFKFKDRHKKELALGPTHEEEMVDVARKRVKSYQDLPFALFQIQNKFRNEMRATGGLLRTREFIMKDLYDFQPDKKSSIVFYEKVKKAYFRIFKRCGLKLICVEASSGTIGGKISNEFMLLSEIGEDRILVCKKCGYAVNTELVKNARKCPDCRGLLETKESIELGHVFFLGTKYSKKMGLTYKDKDGKEKFVSMGCYGIGLPRLMAAVVEVHNDKNGIVWPKEVAPFDVYLISVENIANVAKVSNKLYKDLLGAGIEVLYDDRENKSTGEKFVDCDLIGIPIRVVISEKTLKKNCAEIKKRKEKKIKLVKIDKLIKYLQNQI